MLSKAFQETPMSQALQTQLVLRHGKSGQAAAVARDQTEQAVTAGLHSCSTERSRAEAAGAVMAAEIPQLQAAQEETQGAKEGTQPAQAAAGQALSHVAPPPNWHIQPKFTFKGAPGCAIDEGYPFPNSVPQVWSFSNQPA